VLAVCQVAIHGDTAVKIYCHSCSFLSSSASPSLSGIDPDD